jgi:hypothetical protein
MDRVLAVQFLKTATISVYIVVAFAHNFVQIINFKQKTIVKTLCCQEMPILYSDIIISSFLFTLNII